MPDLRFYRKNSDFKLADIRDLILNFDRIKGDINIVPHDIATLTAAESNDISFYHNARYRQIVEQSQAKFILCSQDNIDHVPKHSVPIVVSSPQRAYAIVAQKMYLDPEKQFFVNNNNDESLTRFIDKDIVIEPGVVIDDNVDIGHNTRIGANTVIRSGVSIGDNCRIGPNCVISHSLIGNGVTLFPGVKVGQAGFGFVMDDRGHITIPQLGRVIIEDKVEIGANTTIDRGTLDDTIIGYGTRIDNLVQIGHGVQIGKHCVIVALVGISGSTKLGDRVIAAGQVGIAGHLVIGDDAVIAAKSGVTRDVLPSQKIGGIPGVPLDQWHRQTAILKKMVR